MRGKASIEEQMVKSLLKRKRQYEKYFAGVGCPRPGAGKEPEETDERAQALPPDNQATNAYTGLIKTIVEISRKAPREAGRRVGEKERIAEVLEREYGIRRD